MVYCKNCRFAGFWGDCHRSKPAHANLFTGVRENYVSANRKANETGECPHYELKKWKFWRIG